MRRRVPVWLCAVWFVWGIVYADVLSPWGQFAIAASIAISVATVWIIIKMILWADPSLRPGGGQ